MSWSNVNFNVWFIHQNIRNKSRVIELFVFRIWITSICILYLCKWLQPTDLWVSNRNHQLIKKRKISCILLEYSTSPKYDEYNSYSLIRASVQMFSRSVGDFARILRICQTDCIQRQWEHVLITNRKQLQIFIRCMTIQGPSWRYMDTPADEPRAPGP